PKELNIKEENIPLDIIYEDDDIILINKPQNMVVHPAAGNYEGTLVNALMFHCKGNLSGINGILRPGIVHRIDKDTSGILVVAKNDNAHQKLAIQLANHSMTRVYYAIVTGNLKEDTGTIDAPIGRHKVDRKKMAVINKNSKNAITHYTVLERLKKHTLVKLQLETGRTHQIRVHMAYIGHSLLGDEVYGAKKQPYKLLGQALHAKVLGFIHPTKNEYMEFETELPEYFNNLIKKLR
ncbi:MAG: RluA family pseudouridine synthase, partial [Eubacteriales bacterium]|nr:RluA family pseudouridine synthase [Eubacteriales bacterium]